ncbi:MAG: hypothetical protein ACRDFW_11660 [bacterium]
MHRDTLAEQSLRRGPLLAIASAVIVFIVLPIVALALATGVVGSIESVIR